VLFLFLEPFQVLYHLRGKHVSSSLGLSCIRQQPSEHAGIRMFWLPVHKGHRRIPNARSGLIPGY
jgi:hypothetical protein